MADWIVQPLISYLHLSGFHTYAVIFFFDFHLPCFRVDSRVDFFSGLRPACFVWLNLLSYLIQADSVIYLGLFCPLILGGKMEDRYFGRAQNDYLWMNFYLFKLCYY